MSSKNTDIVVTIQDGIGTIKFNRPKQLNSFGGSLILETITALRELDEHPDTTITVITGEGRFFAAGADVSGVGEAKSDFESAGEKKLFWIQKLAVGVELVRSMIDHTKVLVLAMNGPGVGAGAAWFQGASDLFYAAEGAWLQITFSQLGLVPENGSAYNWANSLGVHRANEILMLGEKISVEELHRVGMVNKIFPKEGFHTSVHEHLKALLKDRDGKSMMEMKRLQNAPLREKRIISLFDASNALAERFVDGEPSKRMTAKMEELKAKHKAKESKL